MATTLHDLHHEGTGEMIPEDTHVVFVRFHDESDGLMAVFRANEPGSPWRGVTTSGVPADGVGIYIHFDSPEEHTAYQQALTAHHLGKIAASLGKN